MAFRDMKWGAKVGMWVTRWKNMGESDEYIQQNLILMFLKTTVGFWDLVRHFEDNESKKLNIECKLDMNHLCSIVWCEPGGQVNCKTMTLAMGVGRRQQWRLTYEDKGKTELVYEIAPLGGIVEAKEQVKPMLNDLLTYVEEGADKPCDPSLQKVLGTVADIIRRVSTVGYIDSRYGNLKEDLESIRAELGGVDKTFSELKREIESLRVSNDLLTRSINTTGD